ncbi:hypothetical protein KPL71_021897 [Citrus sinensis]|uniref:Uncharacterized protein n=1 Tax=Citrus sinensis TaxID=2711 RepID=A0ACB8JIX4_CITSI|nr:hypothetical protein KPL71_021897 [Citrus sinensis]
MATNKERIENLEARLDGLQDGLQQMEIGINDKLHQLEETINRMSEAFFSNKEGSSHNVNNHPSHSYKEHTKEEASGSRMIFSSKMAKLEFPRYAGDDPTEWFSKVSQFFEYQGTSETQKVALASFHLEGEANQWWQWLHKAYKEEGRTVTWTDFEEELWARFGPTECEDFDEALSRVRQVGTLRDYQREFERLGNRVHGWTQKALVGTFMGGLKPEISDGIRMFKPKTLKEAISLARMQADQVQRKFSQPFTVSRTSTSNVKRLTWDEMQRRRAQGLCFNCPEKFTVGHKCMGPQILFLEGSTDARNITYEENEIAAEVVPTDRAKPKISFHSLSDNREAIESI